MTTLLIPIAVFLCVAALVGAGASLFQGSANTSLEDRLSLITGAGGMGRKPTEAAVTKSLLSQPLNAGTSAVEMLVARFLNLPLLIEQADVSISAAKILMICGVLAASGIVVPSTLGLHLAFAPAVAIALGLAPLVWLVMKRNRRFKAFGKQLPDALELMSRALRAGHSLGSGFSLVADEMQAPISKEFSRVFEEQNLGIPLNEALDHITNRIPNLDLKFFATAVVLQRQTGGDLAEILDKIGYIVRERFKIWGQVQALTGEGRLSGVVLLGLPPALFGAVWYLNPDYLMPLFTDPMGKKMLAGGLGLQLLGALVIRKIVNIKV